MRQASQTPMRTLLVDNHDSYTFNLYQLLAQVNGVAPTVVQNDDINGARILRDVSSGAYDSIVISPGPGTPHRATDVGFCSALLNTAMDIPVLGVCLGMQLLAAVHGGRVAHAPEPVHGRLSSIEHNGHVLFDSIPSGPDAGFDVVRYHSLAVEEQSLPACLQPIAWTCGGHHAVLRPALSSAAQLPHPLLNSGIGSQLPADRVLMALAHRDRPHYGVQFHPESIATAFGHVLIENFMQLAQQNRRTQRNGLAALPALSLESHSQDAGLAQQQSQLDVVWRCLPDKLTSFGGSYNLFRSLYGSKGAKDTFWLDSADPERGRFSYMGGRGGALWQRILYHTSSSRSADVPTAGCTATHQGVVSTEDAGGVRHEVAVPSFFCWLEQRLAQLRLSQQGSAAATLPFDFWGGFVGYLGYELKQECGFVSGHDAATPDAAMFLVDRVIAVDHRTEDVYLLAMHDPSRAAETAAARSWLDATAETAYAVAQLQHLAQPAANDHTADGHNLPDASEIPIKPVANTGPVKRMLPCFSTRQSRAQYVADVKSCLKALYDGESYELCLTTVHTAKQQVPALELYQALRRLNPAPYAAWLAFSDDLQVCCSSPERFLRGGRGKTLEAKPIKGTARRILGDAAADAVAAAALAASEKDRAENLMIVDLLRNDLGRVCQVGTVHVPALMNVESFSTVHQLVSTVRGLRRPDASIVDCLRAAFPGGSMTGAPKQRSVAILDKLEGAPRGIYSGALGYIGLNDTFDLNIVIRTAVVHKGSITIGAGGAIVVQSDPEDEYEEMELKAAALIAAVQTAASADTAD